MTKATSKSTALSLITRKIQAEKELNKPDSFFVKSPEQPRSLSSTEEETAANQQSQTNDADEVSRELDMDCEEEEESTEEMTLANSSQNESLPEDWSSRQVLNPEEEDHPSGGSSQT